MKKSGFTLAEILISLMILGVIAALTIPSLIQNTHKKEEIVKMNKAISVLNQAISMDKALTGEDMSQYETEEELLEALKKRLNVSESELVYDTPAFRTQDGIIYSISTGRNSNGNYYQYGNIFTQANLTFDELFLYVTDTAEACSAYTTAKKNNPFGGTAYSFRCVNGVCSFINGAEEIVNAKDPSKYHKDSDCVSYTSN